MSTRSALTVVGAVVGAYFGYPQLGMVVGGLIGSAVDPATIQGPAINEVAVQTQAEGVPRIIPFGTVSCVGNVIQNGPLIKTTEYSSQGKGGASVETPTAYRTFAIGICEGPIAGMLRVWEDNTLVYDVRPGSLMLAESARWMQNKFLHTGEESQEVDPFLEFIDPETPAYRGTAYLTFVLENQTDRGGSFKQYRFEVATSATSTPLDVIPSLFSNVQTVSGTLVYGESHRYSTGTVPFPGARVARFKIAMTTTIPEAGVYMLFTVDYGVGKVFTGRIDGNGEIVVQLSTLNEPITVTVDMYKVAAVETPFFYQSSIHYPSPPNIGPDYVAFAGGLPAPDLIYPDDPYWGILDDPDDGLVSADWGPGVLEQTGAPVTLHSIVSVVHSRCGIASTLFNTSELTAMVDGFSIAGPYTGADAINGLRAVHMFDKSDHDGKLWYPKRGKAVVKTLTIDDLTEVPDTSQREQASEIPYKLNLGYQHAASGYAKVKATAPGTPSPDRRTTGEVSMDTAIVMNEDRAAQVADMIYKVTLAEANGTMGLSVPLAVAADLADADCIGLSLRGRVTRWRIEQSAFTNWTVKFTLRSDRQSAYTSNVTGIPIPPPTLPPSTIVGDTEMVILDLPARTDNEDDLNYLAAVSGSLPPWYGAQLQRSLDAGATYANVQQFDQAAIMGVLTAAVAAASAHYTDSVNAVNIQLYRSSQTLDNITDLQFLSEQGAFALENADGSWEVMQYRDAEVELDGTITLTTLHRGLLNTGGTSHSIGARFVLLSTAAHIAASGAWLGLNLTHQAVSLGESADDTTNDETLTFAGKSQIEWPVSYLAVTRNLSNVLTGSWVPRPRLGSDVNPIQSVNFVGYRVTIVGSSTVTFDVPSASFTYDASALGVSVTVSVSALNRITGAGPAVSTTA